MTLMKHEVLMDEVVILNLLVQSKLMHTRFKETVSNWSTLMIFRPWVYQMGSLVIAFVRP